MGLSPKERSITLGVCCTYIFTEFVKEAQEAATEAAAAVQEPEPNFITIAPVMVGRSRTVCVCAPIVVMFSGKRRQSKRVW